MYDFLTDRSPARLSVSNDRFFFGVVTASDPGTFTVQVAPTSERGANLLSGIPLASCLASSLGAKECAIPQPGSTVFCFKRDGTSCLILGTVPQQDSLNEPSTFHARSVLGSGDGINNGTMQGYAGQGISKTATQNNNRPTDVVSGEAVWANDFGALIGLFHNFAVLKASELAQVQAIVLDDLVRIVSHNYQHYTCMGETKVYQDGPQLTMEFGATHDATEALGIPNTDGTNTGKSSVILHGETSIDDTKDFVSLGLLGESEGKKALEQNDKLIGIERLRGFIGALGEFVHLIFSVPHKEQQRALDGKETGKYDKGLTSFKVDLDGGVYLRSVKGINLEKTNWIRVPQRIVAADDNTTPVEVNKANPASLVDAVVDFQFDQSSARREDLPFLYYLQLRDYLAYVQEAQAYNELQNNAKFEINNNRPGIETKPTKVSAYRSAKFEKQTAGFYLMPNGGITLRDAWGSAIVLEGGNVYIQPSKDIIFQPMRNMIGKIGGAISLAAQKDIEQTSTFGGFRLKTDKAQYLYSDSSGIILHANASTPYAYAPEDGSITDVGGIVLHAPKSAVTAHGKYNLFKSEENTAIKASTLAMDTDKRLMMRCNDGMQLYTKGEMFMAGGTSLVQFTEGQAIFVGNKGTAIGKNKQMHAMSTVGAVTGMMEEDSFDSWRDTIQNALAQDFQYFAPVFREDDSFEKLKFRFPTSTEYGVVQYEDFIPQTIAQQEDKQFKVHDYKPWEEKPINETYPYPGIERRECYATAELTNLAFDPDTMEIYNKAIEHTLVGKVTVGDVFKDYTAYGK